MKSRFNFKKLISNVLIALFVLTTSIDLHAQKKKKMTKGNDLTGMVLNLYPVRGLTTSKKYLSTNKDASYVDLWNKDDESGRQRWSLKKTSDGFYNILIYSGVENSRKYLSVTSDGAKVDLYSKDDKSGRQRWQLIEIEDDLYQVTIKDGVSNNRKYLSVTADGSKVDLYHKDDESGRQQWKIESVDLQTPKKPIKNEIDLKGMTLNIYPVRGLTTSRKFLSTKQDGSKVDLWNKDDESGRQRWCFEKTPDGFYNILIYSGVENSKRFLSVTSDGSKVDLYHKDDNSGRQKWQLIEIGNNLYQIRIKGGVANGKKYLSVIADGSKVDLYHKDDKTGRQQWKIESVGEWELTDIKYFLSPDNIVISEPDFISEATIRNGTKTAQRLTCHFQKKATETSSFSSTKGTSVKVAATIEVGIPHLADGEIQTEVTGTASWTYGGSETKEDIQTYDFPILVPPMAAYKGKAIVSRNKISANYEAILTNKISGKTKKIKGRWEGIICGNINYELTDCSDPDVLKKFSNKPSRAILIE